MISHQLCKLKKTKVKILYLFILSLLTFLVDPLNSSDKKIYSSSKKLLRETDFVIGNFDNETIANIKWDLINPSSEKKVLWEKTNSEDLLILKKSKEFLNNEKTIYKINSFNRSIVFNNEEIGPDVSWIVPSGFSWNEKFKFDLSARGHNTQIPDPPSRNFFSWNDGDAIGLISYQFLHNKKSSFGINIGIRSLYQGNSAAGGSTKIGEGISSGFRWDYEIDERSGIAIGAEQLIHYDSTTDSGRNIYVTASKAWFDSNSDDNSFPIYIATAGLGTGRMAVGPINGLCSDLAGGSGTEFTHRRLCWAPVFSLASVWNKKLSTFFEYNSRFFVLGSSFAPSQKIPLRGTFALILSDHIDNYKFHDVNEMNWVFNISLGF